MTANPSICIHLMEIDPTDELIKFSCGLKIIDHLLSMNVGLIVKFIELGFLKYLNKCLHINLRNLRKQAITLFQHLLNAEMLDSLQEKNAVGFFMESFYISASKEVRESLLQILLQRLTNLRIY